MVGWWFFSDYRVSPNFLVVLGLRLGLGCDNSLANVEAQLRVGSHLLPYCKGSLVDAPGKFDAQVENS